MTPRVLRGAMRFEEGMAVYERELEAQMWRDGTLDRLMALTKLGDALAALVLPWIPMESP